MEKDVHEHIERLAGKGNYILTSSHSVTNDIPFENFNGHDQGGAPLRSLSPQERRAARPGLPRLEHPEGIGRKRRLRGAKTRTDSGSRSKAAGEVFTPITQYGVCAGCPTRAVIFLVPDGTKLCERCFKKEGWALVHEGPDKGLKKIAGSGTGSGRSDTLLC